MYLKRIKIFGFKSFADEVIFDFTEGITAIVGPNGCGKSNVLDAFNWVLGEQSATRLRGGQMQDMIFHGSRTRKPLGVASVELTLDNSRDLLPIDYDEVTVVRKLYRSGESEYFINKVPCRRKDIRELFMDTGIGRRAYSVMEQANISYILESTPQERRSLLEEAAGIRKYKEKKLEAERRLERIRTDLNEVKNIMAEVQKNIRRLKRQTRRAEIYRDLKSELKTLEISRLCQEYVSISDQLGGKEESTGDMQKKVMTFSGEKEKLDAKVLGLETQKAELDDKLLEDNRKVYQTESRMAIINERINNFSENQKRLNEELQRHNQNLEYNSKRVAQLDEELEQLNRKTKKEKKIEDKFEELDKIVKSLREEHAAVQQEITTILQTQNADEEQLLKLRKNEINLVNVREISAKQLKDLKLKKQELEQNSNIVKKDLEVKNTNLKQHEADLEKISNRIEELRKNFNEASSQYDNITLEKDDLQQKYHSTKSQFDASKQYLPQLLSIEKLSHKKIPGVLGQLATILEKQTSEQESHRLSELLGGKMSWILVENKKSALQSIAFLKENDLPPLTFILLDSVKETSSTLTLPSDLSKELKSVISFCLKDVVLKDGLTWKNECVLSGGGQTPPRVKKILGLENVIEKIEEKLTVINQKEQEIKEKRLSLQAEIQDLINKRNSQQMEYSALKSQTGQLMGNSEYLENAYKELEQRIKSIKPEDELEAELKTTQKNLKELNEALLKTRTQFKKLQEKNIKLTEEVAKNETKRNALEEVIQREKENLASVTAQRSQLSEDVKRIKKLIEDITFRQESLAGQNNSDQKEIAELLKDKDTQKQSVGELEDVKGKLVRELKEFKTRQRELEITLEKLKNEVGEQRQTEVRLKERIHSITERLQENLNVELKDALENYSKEEIDEAQIISLRAKLEKIGDVNLEAPKEFDREYQRFEFIKTHVDDLEEADADLKSIIRRINKQTKDRFFEVFNQINENFKAIFTKLFEGGRAELSLSEPENILETGVEIYAKPEGKNVASIIQLSGGESALTAIALMFAIYQVKPTPFCILDEVDSPLDDANLNRFLRMLRDYIDNTQFIIVTHNKQTMEMSDAFYGITMEEFGVSKTISVKLRDSKADIVQ